MKEFYKFEEYVREHMQEFQYDVSHLLAKSGNNELLSYEPDLTQEISALCVSTTMSLLRAYHSFLQDQP